MPWDNVHLTTNTDYILTSVLNKYTPQKRKSFEVIKGLIWTKNWEKQLCYGLETKLTKSDVNIKAYKKLWNYVVALNQESKCDNFNNLDVSKGVNSFWKTSKTYFSKC